MPLVEISQLSLRYAHLRILAPRRQAGLAASIAQRGQLSPVLIHTTDQEKVLIDGYARVGALQALGRDLVQVLELETSSTEALLVAYRLQGRRRRSSLEEGWLLRTLVEEHGVAQRDLAPKLGRSPSWVSRHLALARVLPESVQDVIRRGDLCPQGAMKSLVPLARANTGHCERMVASLLRGTPPSVRQLDQLYCAWKSADDIVRDRIVDKPQLYLRAAEAASATQTTSFDEVGAQLTELRRDIEKMGPPLNLWVESVSSS